MKFTPLDCLLGDEDLFDGFPFKIFKKNEGLNIIRSGRFENTEEKRIYFLFYLYVYETFGNVKWSRHKKYGEEDLIELLNRFYEEYLGVGFKSREYYDKVLGR